ncbi:MAG: hypothetical protein AB7U98_10110 [Candidatus Nitrosocosmicus sp.]|jgi:hypothetical protein|uniref:hypothetical protein n=1 Tax=Candidatus Nitrosocosmicus sp. FF01 TaxID=3397670 RepID=UPI002A718E65|nr:hypothetical protein [Candidatus Nitrosocosmicus sp.]
MRVRYWRLNLDELRNGTYPIDNANHWEIKCLQGEHEHFGVFWYRYGTPFDKEPVNGICFYFNEIPYDKVQDIANFLNSKYGGKILFRQTRGFLQGSKEFADKESIAQLAEELSLRYNAPIEMTIEFERIDKEQQDRLITLPAGKALPIVGPD